MSKREMTLEMSVTGTEIQIMQMSLSMLVSMIQGDIDEWENKDDKSIDLLSGMYDKQFAVMSVWRKVLISAGVPSEVIAGVISGEITGDEDEDEGN